MVRGVTILNGSCASPGTGNHISLSYPYISFCFLHTYLIALSCFTSLYEHLFIYNACIHPTKDYSPKSDFLKYSFSIHYGVKFKHLTTCICDTDTDKHRRPDRIQ